MSLVSARNPRAFAVRHADVSRIANAEVLYSRHFGDLKGLANCAYPLRTIGDMLIEVQDGLHGVRRYVPVGVPLLGVGNVTEDGIDLSEVNRITDDEHQRLAASHVREGDLLVTITGRLGTAAIYDIAEPANLSAHVALCRAKPGQDLRFLKYYLASRFGAASLTSAQIGSTHPHINVRRLIELPIPLPDGPTQTALANALDAARSARASLIAAAKELLQTFDEFLLTTLGIPEPKRDRRNVFAINLRELMNSQFTADYYHPEKELALRALANVPSTVSVRTLSEIVWFERNQIRSPIAPYLSLAHVQSNTGELLAIEEDASGACYTFRTGDVLFARLRPYLNKVYRAEMGGSCSPEFHVLRVIDKSIVRPDYLAAVLRSRLVLAQTVHMMTGNTHPRLSNDDVQTLRIPIPPPEVQDVIANEVAKRRERVRVLRTQAEETWSEAKAEFEQHLLTGTKS